MPIHDWTQASAGGFHNFHQDWTIEIYRALNRGLLPPGYSAFTDLRIEGWEPDAVTIQTGKPKGGIGYAVDVKPPKSLLQARIETDTAAYARKANRVVVRHEYGNVVCVLEVVSPGNKDSTHAINSFRTKILHFLNSGVNVVIVDLFPPSPRDPNGIHELLWASLTDEPFQPRPGNKPLTIASYDAGADFTAYVDPIAVGDALPDAPLFLAPGWYVNVPLEQTYQSAWDVTPEVIQNSVR